MFNVSLIHQTIFGRMFQVLTTRARKQDQLGRLAIRTFRVDLFSPTDKRLDDPSKWAATPSFYLHSN